MVYIAEPLPRSFHNFYQTKRQPIYMLKMSSYPNSSTLNFKKDNASDIMIGKDFLVFNAVKLLLSEYSVLSTQFCCPKCSIVSTGCIWWILWFCICYASAAHREIFDVNTLIGKLHQLASPNLQEIFIGKYASLDWNKPHSEKQDICRMHFFENYLSFSTGWFS